MTTKPTIVCIMRALSHSGSNPPATIYTKGRSGKPAFTRMQHLTPTTKAELGDDLTGYFEAELIDDAWFVGKRIWHQLGW